MRLFASLMLLSGWLVLMVTAMSHLSSVSHLAVL